MSIKRLANARQKTVGAKQTMKAVEKGRAKVVYVAKNAERRVTEPIIKVCQDKAIPIEEVESMQLLGKTCGIEVRCAVASIIED
ncbi:ribosomal L7Ae/L30e/S12e/Gadd45 family protein [Desulfofalx alkaliphila]|uniref:ribosomal L7Ae/L30e/S12e/Gadd45 family protein n=1 Tax=Desulfofalx alkaliphila TaxID=105483 RepID=UPI0004E22814|nr:ribosomal L7Ae/L30e/S12e/Gadd45 family protein [Desulfofalx alkaliphila]